MVNTPTVEEVGKLRQRARDEHFAAREARAAYTIEMTQRLAGGTALDEEFVRRGADLEAAVNAAQGRFKDLDRQHKALIRGASARP